MAEFHPPIDWTQHRLHAAGASGNKTVVEQLIAEGADVNQQVNERLANSDVAATPLHITISSCPWNEPYNRNASSQPELVFNAYYEIVEALLDAGADAHLRRPWSGTPLHDAAKLGLIDIVKLMVSRGADINCREDYKGHTPLHAAAGGNRPAMVEYLLSNGADINAVSQLNPPAGTMCLRLVRREEVGMTPLQLAAREGHISVVKVLIAAASSPDIAAAIDRAERSQKRIESQFDELTWLLRQKSPGGA